MLILAAGRPLDRQILRQSFPHVFLPGSAFGGQGIFHKLLSLARLFWAILAAISHVRRCRCIVAFGGFPSVASVLAAKLCGVKVYLHEQNAVPGRANRLLAPLAKKIFMTFEEAAGKFGPRKSRCVLTGCPVRKKILIEREPAGRGRMRMLVVGGSQGSKFFLDFFSGRPDFFAWLMERLDVLFLAGPNLADIPAARRLIDNARDLRGSFTLLPFLERMGPAIRSADIVLSRAGASFLAELASVGKARVVLVPYPRALDDHQTANARAILAHPGALADVQIFEEGKIDKLEEALRAFIVAGPVDPPQTFSDRHAGAACRILEELRDADGP
ncbi:glycosyltransferase [bacterium]|nr:glycosyltransferase [bacterium]